MTTPGLLAASDFLGDPDGVIFVSKLYGRAKNKGFMGCGMEYVVFVYCKLDGAEGAHTS